METFFFRTDIFKKQLGGWNRKPGLSVHDALGWIRNTPCKIMMSSGSVGVGCIEHTARLDFPVGYPGGDAFHQVGIFIDQAVSAGKQGSYYAQVQGGKTPLMMDMCRVSEGDEEVSWERRCHVWAGSRGV